ncbi:formate-dependent phosphoribosylglycinamide formyltransferase [Mycobacterium sp.]|uniref:formate-dependent phosphoribosylglycinamide formyltransferase n=1 Tax=Mycobacterium sp. TaxID=1785 RepID=UPI003F9B83D2
MAEGVPQDESTRGKREQPPAHQLHRTTVMLLGSGEFSRELALAFQRLGAGVIAVDRYADAPAHGVADQSLVVNMTDTDELGAVIRRFEPNFVVTASDVVATDALIVAAEAGLAEVFPTARCARLTADREGLRRLAADELGLPTAPFWFAGSLDELRAVADHAGYPLRVQPVAATVGAGQSVVLLPADIETAWQRAASAGGRLAHNRVLAETLVEIDFHVTLLTVRSVGPTGPTIEFCAPIGHGEAIGDVQESWQPQDMSVAALDTARSIAARIVKALGGRGVFGVELMVRGDEVYFSDVTARPFESGLVTLRTQRLSEFELQARAILGLPTDAIMISPGAAEVIYAGHDGSGLTVQSSKAVGVLADALRVPESDARVFGRHEPEGRRPLGVAVVTASDVSTARTRAREVSAALRRLW